MKSASLLLSFLVLNTHLAIGNSMDLINGVPVPEGSFPEVVMINSGAAKCSGVVVGPRAVLTAAHCSRSGYQVAIMVDKKPYMGRVVNSPLHPSKDHDIAVIIADEIIPVRPGHVGGLATVGQEVLLLGYGATEPGGGGFYGVLRSGSSVIIGHNEFDMVSTMPGGAAVSFGDSGSPAMVQIAGGHFVVGIATKGNIVDTSYHTRTDIDETRDFLKQVATESDIIICGVNSNCQSER